jgi:hypothetical protein
VVNVLTGERAELAPVIAGHRDIDGVLAARGSASGLDGALAGVLEAGAAENLKRVRVYGEGRISWDDDGDWSCPERIEDVVEAKTIWHPSSM